MASRAGMHQANKFSLPQTYVGQKLDGRFRDNIPVATAESSGLTLSTNTSIPAEFFVSDGIEHTNVAFMTVMKALGTVGVTDHTSIHCLYGSAMALVFPSMKDKITEVLNDQGYALTEVKLPSQAQEFQMEVPARATKAQVLILLGQLILIVYKNLTDLNMKNYLGQRINGLKAAIGISPHVLDIMVTKELKVIHSIQAVFGNSHSFKADLIQRVIDGWNEAPPANGMFSYTGNILKYVGMAAFVFIAETLMYHKSPVLRHPAVQAEVDNLADAFYLICQSDYPQYFRILAPPAVGAMLERSRFPILLTVAQRIKFESYSSVTQFRSAIPQKNLLVDHLVELHQQHVSRLMAPNRAAFSYLTSLQDGSTERPMSEATVTPTRVQTDEETEAIDRLRQNAVNANQQLLAQNVGVPQVGGNRTG